jgi:glyoxylase-like metal-dependent hydrolase (beta-lactamase superfamily II)
MRPVIAGLTLSWLISVVISAAAGAAATPPLKPQRVAPGVYALIGAREEISPANFGNISNSGFIIGSGGVIVVDTGANHAHGERILAAIRSLTAKPVVLAINTHPHPENVLGNSAFADRGIPLLAHSETLQAMRQRCELCYQNSVRVLGDHIMAGTRIVVPGQSIGGSTQLTIGGRRLGLLHLGWGHTEGDLAVLDHATGTLFSGGLVSLDRIPDLGQAKIKGWIAALEQLQKPPVAILVPGHGPVSAPLRMRDTLGYLKGLLAQVEKRYGEGMSILEVRNQAGLPAYRNWSLQETHPQNLQHVYIELEQEELAK